MGDAIARVEGRDSAIPGATAQAGPAEARRGELLLRCSTSPPGAVAVVDVAAGRGGILVPADERLAVDLAGPDRELTGDLVEEARRRVPRRRAPRRSRQRPGEVEPLAGAGDADVGEATFLGELGRVAERAQVREDAVLEPGQENHRELEPLGRVEGHQGDDAAGIVGVGDRVGVGDERDLFEERHERGRLVGARVLLLELPRHADELAQVVDAPLVLRITAGFELTQVTGLVEHRLEDRAGRAVRTRPDAADLGEQGGEVADRVQGPVREPERLVGPLDGRAEGDAFLLGEDIDAGHRPIADTAAGRVQDAPQADDVVGVGDHPQVGQCVADLAPLVEAHTAHDLVRQADADEHLLEDTGLRVGAIEDGDAGGDRGPRVGELVDALRNPGRLVVLVLGDVAVDLLAGTGLGPEVLRFAVGVSCDDGIGGGQDRLGGAVVLLQQDRGRVRVVALELEDVADARATECVDGLVGVSDHREFGGGCAGWHGWQSQLAHQHVLGVVGVLVLIDQDVPEPPPVVLGHVGMLLQQAHRRHDQVVEVEGVRLEEPALVAGVGLTEHLLVRVAGLVGPRLGRHQLVLEVADLRRQRPRRVALRIQVQVAADHRHQPLRVIGVIDRER